MTYDLETCVDKAADLLTEMYPRWERSISLEHLDMGSTGSCVLGQLGYNRGMTYSELFGAIADSGKSDRCVEIAFDLGYAEEEDLDYVDDWDRLQLLWHERVERALAEAFD
jgi:hypothetical protein